MRLIVSLEEAKFRHSTAVMLAGTLALAGCGGSDDPKTPPADDTASPPPTALENASDAQAAALAAQAEAKKLLAGAVAAAKAVSGRAAGGSSKSAQANATTVLSASTAIQAEYEKATKAHTAAQAAHTAAPADQKARIAVIVAAAKGAMDAIKAIQDAKDITGKVDGSLAEAVSMVRAGAKATDTDAMIAAAKAKAVATAVKGAISNQIPDSDASPAIELNNTGSIVGAPAGAVMTAGLAGMNFKEIMGGSTVTTATVKGFTTTATGTTNVTAVSTSGTEAFYKGIEGNLTCLSTSCSIATATGAITGVAVFAPDDQTTLWTQKTYGGNYTAVTNAATYGHWLNADCDAITLHSSIHSTGLSWAKAATVTTSTQSATYKGKAGGYSEKTTGTGTAAKTASGAFTADVTLDATFGADADAAKLKGSIKNFAGGDHVDPTWFVGLNEKTSAANFGTTQAVTKPGVVTGMKDASSGGWQASAYGETGKQPSGFVGIFSAGFVNGSAAGSYQASKSAN